MKYTVFWILLTFFCNSSTSQGLTSNYADSNGSYLNIGPPSTQFSIPINLSFGNNSIFTKGGPIGAFKRPTLKLNPINGNVTVGNTESDFAALTIKSFSEANNTLDLRLEGDGRIGIQRSLYFDLDDDNNEDSYFLIRDSNKNNLFTVGETGQSYLKGDLTIDGDIKVNGSLVGSPEIKLLSSHAFSGGNESIVARVHADSWVISGWTFLGADLCLPHNAHISKIEIIYLDNSPDDIVVRILSVPNLSNLNTSNKLFEWDSSNDSPNFRQATLNNLNITIDNINQVYFVQVQSGNWGRETVKFRAIKIYYTR